MSWVTFVLVVLGLIFLALIVYWQFIIAEGTYLGSWAVTWLYDWSAHVYERIKGFNVGDEQWFLGLPLARALAMIPAPLVLDVATGTGRLPRALLRQPAFEGRVIGLDLSRRMLREAVQRTAQFADRLTYIWQDAQELPFEDGTFDAVTCLEALEFMPDPHRVIVELIRVLRPGGVLLLTNRIGKDARFLPRRVFPRDEFELMLQETYPLEDVKVQVWQVDYDLAWGVKRGEPRGGSIRPLPDIMRCPHCGHRLGPALADSGNGANEAAYHCRGCRRVYPIAEDGVIEIAQPRRP
ncbi:MAG TPA: methyltransferase domain-containing protein [Chloroflexi bacterium]|mgnify:CR=1 FL=1|nr:methyltransferase domain-containing protein [Chloroflexota bacterium]